MAALFLCPPFLSYCSVLRGIPSFLLCLGYSRDIRGVFVGYSWDIRMYRVCVGYVSGMYRESVEGDGARGGRYANHGRARMDTEKKNIDILARKLAEI